MRAVLIDRFGEAPTVTDLPEPELPAGGAILQVRATGLCRSDWHAWLGHDATVSLPHVPGHELAATIAEIDPAVPGWQAGQRVIVPFVCACGECEQCLEGNQQVCTRQLQPGFDYWGSFAEYVAVPYAAVNLVALPDELGFDSAAALGCRFATAYRAVTAVGNVQPGEWLAVFGCGGVGLSVVMIAAAAGAQVIAVDTNPAALAMASRHGAGHTVLAGRAGDPAGPGDGTAEQIRQLTGGGAAVTMDAIGAESVVQTALASLRPRGRHVQLGLLPEPVRLDMSSLAFRELSWLGSHGMAAHDYPAMLELVRSGAVRPDELVTGVIGLDGVGQALAAMSGAAPACITVIHPGGEPG
ncbi:zinc-binding dehydrogenase [Jatrophihabitans sp.]|uniref:zinc-binding dehydrogenase n=1 Tax=Jatrophihabitans sp. TaxID=1932789 RepID=UPI002C7CC054|nr:alcohol dehydrogenase catalytic domain-containing protein [Jatrophihabitans sp.]